MVDPKPGSFTVVLLTVSSWGRAGINVKAKEGSYMNAWGSQLPGSSWLSVREKSVCLITEDENTGDCCLLTRSQIGTVT